MKKVKIEVIGSGCAKCKKLFELTKEVSVELGIEDDVLYSTDINKIAALGIMSSPIVTVDGVPVLVGMLPDKDRLKEIIYQNVLSENAKKEDQGGENSCCSCS